MFLTLFVRFTGFFLFEIRPINIFSVNKGFGFRISGQLKLSDDVMSSVNLSSAVALVLALVAWHADVSCAQWQRARELLSSEYGRFLRAHDAAIVPDTLPLRVRADSWFKFSHEFEEADVRAFVQHGRSEEQARLRKGSQGAHAGLNKPSAAALDLARRSVRLEFATREMAERRPASLRRRRRQVAKFFSRLFSLVDNSFATSMNQNGTFALREELTTAPETVLVADCAKESDESECANYQAYRTFSGFCNNVRHPILGRHTSPFRRLLPPEYDDRVSRPRARSAERGRSLANVRSVSAAVHGDKDRSELDKRHTLMLMQWGQFLDHDITLTPMFRGLNSSILDCSACDSNGQHEGCYPILVS